MKREELIKLIKDRYITAHCNPDFTGDKMSFIFNDLSSHPEPAQEQEKQTAEEGLLDLQQYVTNLLYYAHVEAMDMHSIDFDKWVEREVDNLRSYYASQSQSLPYVLPSELISRISDAQNDIADVAKSIQEEYFHDDDVSGGYIEGEGKEWCASLYTIEDNLRIVKSQLKQG